MPPSYRPPVYGMMPPQQCPYQTGMEYTMATRCPPQQPPPPYPGSCMSYDMCQQAHSNLNPYAEPFMVGPHGPAGQQFCCHSDDHRCLVPPHGQVGQCPVNISKLKGQLQNQFIKLKWKLQHSSFKTTICIFMQLTYIIPI